MATFTLELWQVLDALYGDSMDEDDYEQQYSALTFNGVTYGKLPILPNYDEIGLAYYPIFNEGYRQILNGKIIDEYFKREIGVETIDLFTLNLRKRMDQIMPFYNQLYESTMIEYSALDSMRIHSVGTNHAESEDKNKANVTAETDTKSSARVIGSDFPQSMLAGNADYATNGSDTNSGSGVDSKSNQDSEAESKTDSNSDTLVTGYQGAASDLINKFRASLINVDMMILTEVEDCFMLVLNNGDEYFARDGLWRF